MRSILRSTHGYIYNWNKHIITYYTVMGILLLLQLIVLLAVARHNDS